MTSEIDSGSSEEILCDFAQRNSAKPHLPRKPFSSTSIWNRTIASFATPAVFASVSDSLAGSSDTSPQRITPDIVALCEIDKTGLLTNIEQSQGWSSNLRSQSSGQVLYQRLLAKNTCGCVNWNPIGNGLFVLIDPDTLTADLGVGGWRIQGGVLLNAAPIGSTAHGLNLVSSNGVTGYGRASSLPAIGGLIRSGELSTSIEHAMALLVPSTKLYGTPPYYTWPAQSADASASQTYLGTNPNFRMGTLLAIPPSIDLNNYTWKTTQGRIVANAAKEYGFYIVDSSSGTPSHDYQIAIEDETAYFDLGIRIDSAGNQIVANDASTYNPTDFNSDLVQVLSLVQAVSNNSL